MTRRLLIGFFLFAVLLTGCKKAEDKPSESNSPVISATVTKPEKTSSESNNAENQIVTPTQADETSGQGNETENTGPGCTVVSALPTPVPEYLALFAPREDDWSRGPEDARVTFIDGRYYINYTIVSGDGWSTALSVTDDFRTHERLGVIFHPQNKDVSIFPEKVNGKYIALHRPNNDGFGKPSIWYSESPDLLHWGNHKCIVRPRQGVYESMKVGGGSAPLKTDKGWLCIYHAKGDNAKYSLFPMLLDLEEPWRVIARPERPIFEPEMPYETGGFFSNVVFTNGMLEKDGNIYMYYGSADETSCLAVASVNDLIVTFL